MSIIKTNKDSQVFRLEELRDSIADSIDNIVKVCFQQKALTDLIIDAKKDDEFVDFIKGLEESYNQTMEQKDTLSTQLKLVDECIEQMKASAEIDEFASLLFKALRIFDK